MAKSVTVAVEPQTYPTVNVLTDLRVHSLGADPLLQLDFGGMVPDLEADGVTQKTNSLGKPQHKYPSAPWNYSRYLDASKPAVQEALGGVVFTLVKEAFVDAGVVKTDAEILTLVEGLAARGVDLWTAIEGQCQKLEDKVQAGTIAGHRTAVSRGAEVMEKAGITTG